MNENEKDKDKDLKETISEIQNKVNLENDDDELLDNENTAENKENKQDDELKKKQINLASAMSFFKKKKKNDNQGNISNELKKKPLGKKAYISIIAVLAVVAVYGGYTFEQKLSESKIQTPHINTVAKKPIAKPATAINATVNATNATNSTNATASNAVANPLSPKSIQQNASAIVKTVNKSFDIFSLEPTQEYKLDQMKNYYEKSLDILKLQKDILKTQDEMQSLNKPVKEAKEEKPQLPVIAPPPVKLPAPPSMPSGTVPFPTQAQGSMPFNVPPPNFNNNNGSASMSNSNVLGKVSVNLIYDYKDKKIAVVQYQNSIFRAGVGDNVAPGYRVTRIESNGIYVNGPEGEAFLPLSFKSETKNSVVFTSNSHTKTGQQAGTESNQMNGSMPFNPPAPVFNPSNPNTPPAFIGGNHE